LKTIEKKIKAVQDRVKRPITAMAREMLEEVCQMRKDRPANPGH
jgi:hypothetical protein